ncbi:MAG: hypothetical protein NTZ48_04810 [Candidatus Omnitrophica bacterium]|nr:hypothetical protein [Candidatus Omnitrophota bacterium]
MTKLLIKTILVVMLVATVASAQSEKVSDENVLAARILSINRIHNFLVIDLGTSDGIGEGTSLNLLKNGQSVATIQVVRAKGSVSACDIKRVNANVLLKEGDVYSFTLTSAKSLSRSRVLKEENPKAKKKSKDKRISSLDFISALPMMIHIDARREVVNYYLNEALRDLDFVITSSNMKDGIFTAHKFMPIDFWDEVWADFAGTSDHRAVYDINTIDDQTGTTLKLDIRITYITKGGEPQEKRVSQKSSAAKDALELVKRVKNMSETLTRER